MDNVFYLNQQPELTPEEQELQGVLEDARALLTVYSDSLSYLVAFLRAQQGLDPLKPAGATES